MVLDAAQQELDPSYPSLKDKKGKQVELDYDQDQQFNLSKFPPELTSAIYNGKNLSNPIKNVEDKWELLPAFLQVKGLVKQQ